MSIHILLRLRKTSRLTIRENSRLFCSALLTLLILLVPASVQKASPDLTEDRGVIPSPSAIYPEYVDRWAIIVGISKYKDEGLNLNYAHRDAEELYRLLQKPSGGGFEQEHIVKLVNEEASTAALTRALRTFLKKPAKEDIVLVYFAAHGAPDPERPKNIYLLTHDTDPDDISGTALPMREIQASLAENLLAERVILLADTCHSATVATLPGARGMDNSGVVNRYLQELSKTKPGIALMTSAEAEEVAREGDIWGGGHGVFTYYLLQGMKGDADAHPVDGTVTVGELFEYVREKVKAATNNQQHPSIGQSRFDRDLPMAVSGGATANELYRLGRGLYELGIRVDEPWVIQSAGSQLSQANRLARNAGTYFPEANVYLGKSLLAAGEFERAERVLRNLARDQSIDPEVLYYFAVTQQKLQRFEEAREALRQYLERDPHSSKAAWVRAQLETPDAQNRYALVIGVSELPLMNKWTPIPGVKKDIENIQELLIFLGIKKENIIVLSDSEATRETIIKSLMDLGKNANESDSVWIHYSGHSNPPSENLILPYDYDGSIDTAIMTNEFHRLIVKIPSFDKFITLDTHLSQNLLENASRSYNYTLFGAAKPGEMAQETPKLGGVFTYHLVKTLRDADSTWSYERVADAVNNTIAADSMFNKQIPVLAGLSKQRFLSGGSWLLKSFFDLAERRNWSAIDSDELAKSYARSLRINRSLFPQFHSSMGYAFLDKGTFEEAEAAFERASAVIVEKDRSILLARAAAHAGAGNFKEAFESLEKFKKGENELIKQTTELAKLESYLKELAVDKKRALLVGINDYSASGQENLVSTHNDVLAMKRLLIENFDFEESAIHVLRDADASRANILEGIEDLLGEGRGAPKIFFFSGRGSLYVPKDSAEFSRVPLIADARLTIVPADGRLGGSPDITIEELRQRVGERAEDLVAIFDCGWILRKMASSVLIDDSREKTRGVSFKAAKEEEAVIAFSRSIGLGAVTLFAEPVDPRNRTIHFWRHIEKGEIKLIGADRTEIRLDPELEVVIADPWDGNEKSFGRLTHSIVTILKRNGSNAFSYGELAEHLQRSGIIRGSRIYGDTSHIVFSRRGAIGDEIWRITKRVLEKPFINETITILKNAVERRQGVYPEAFLNLGVAYGYRGEYKYAISALEKAITQGSGNAVEREARYHLGRISFESKQNLARAVDELRWVTEADPNNVKAFFYLGQAIRALVEQDFLSEAEQSLKAYLDGGAPLGHREEIHAFLTSRREVEEPATKSR